MGFLGADMEFHGFLGCYTGFLGYMGFLNDNMKSCGNMVFSMVILVSLEVIWFPRWLYWFPRGDMASSVVILVSSGVIWVSSMVILVSSVVISLPRWLYWFGCNMGFLGCYTGFPEDYTISSVVI